MRPWWPDPTDVEIARRTGRSNSAVWLRRKQLGIPPVTKANYHPWTTAQWRSWEQCLTKSLRHDSATLPTAQKPSGSALESRPSNAKAALFAGRYHSRNASSSRIRPADQIAIRPEDLATPARPSMSLRKAALGSALLALIGCPSGSRIYDSHPRAHDLLKKMTEA
jgi:hypothetical protein